MIFYGVALWYSMWCVWLHLNTLWYSMLWLLLVWLHFNFNALYSLLWIHLEAFWYSLVWVHFNALLYSIMWLHFRIHASGAAGGNGVWTMDGSMGTLVGGLFHLSAGEHLYILVGQKGSDACTLKVCHLLIILSFNN